jgi:hypothetical protein
MVFETNAIFSLKIAENSDHNTNPWSPWHQGMDFNLTIF